jgi:hypothetical protein
MPGLDLPGGVRSQIDQPIRIYASHPPRRLPWTPSSVPLFDR